MNTRCALSALLLVVIAAALPAEDISFAVSETGPGVSSQQTRLAVDAGGNVLLIWRETTPGDNQRFPLLCRLAARRTDGGYALREIRTAVPHADLVNYGLDLAAAPAGKGFLLIWDASKLIDGNPFGNYIFARTINGTATKFGAIRELYYDFRGSSGSPVIATDPANGGAYYACFNFFAAAEYQPGIYGLRIDKKGRRKGDALLLREAETADGSVVSFNNQRLARGDDGSFVLSSLAYYPDFVNKAAVTRILPSYAGGAPVYLQQNGSVLIDAAPLSANRVLAVGSVNGSLGGRSSYRALSAPSLRAKKQKPIQVNTNVSGARILPLSAGGAWLIYFTETGAFRALRFTAKGKPMGQPLELFDSTLVSSVDSAVLIPGSDEVFITFTRLVDGDTIVYGAVASLAS